MKLTIPPKIRWRIKGSVSDSDQRKIVAEARKSVVALTQSMKFQGLSQGRSKVPYGGLLFCCTSVFGAESVDILMRGGPSAMDKKKDTPCWCIRQWSEGVIVEVITREEGSISGVEHCLPVRGDKYPDCVLDNGLGEGNWSNFAGTRYRVNVCQKRGAQISYVCIPNDYDTYEEEDKVVVLYLETLGLIDGFACSVSARDTSMSVYNSIGALDGQFLIMPYIVEPE